MRARIQKWGNSLAVRIPKALAGDIGLANGSSVDLRATNGKVILTPVSESEPTLEELLAQVSKANIHGEVDTGSPVGKEIW